MLLSAYERAGKIRSADAGQLVVAAKYAALKQHHNGALAGSRQLETILRHKTGSKSPLGEVKQAAEELLHLLMAGQTAKR